MFHGLMLVVKYQYARTSQESAVFEMRHIAGVMGEGGRGLYEKRTGLDLD